MMRRFYALLCLMVVAFSVYGFTVDGLVYSENSYYGGVQVEGLVDKSYSGQLVIPETVTYNGVTYPVKVIFTQAFKDCTGLTSVVIGDAVTQIFQGAFNGCSSLESVSFGKSVINIHEEAFYGCSSLAEFTIPEWVNIMGQSVFENTAWYNALSDGFVIKDNVLFGYKGNKPEGELVIQDGIRVVAGGAFKHCPALTSIVLPNTLLSIGDAAFFQSHITTLTIPNSVSYIGEQAFQGCLYLKSITLPASLEEIDFWAFRNCESLEDIYSYIKEPFDIGGAFSYSDGDVDEYYSSVTLHVPAGTKAKYEATEGWKDFKNIVEIDPSGIATIHSEKNGYGAVYNLSGQRLAAPHRGLNIIGGRKVVMK